MRDSNSPPASENTRPGESRDPPGSACAALAYILASKPHGTLYLGSTADLIRRVWEHKIKAIPGFTAKYMSIGWSGTKATIGWRRPPNANDR